MKLIFLFTCTVALMNFIHKTKADKIKYSKYPMVYNLDEECQQETGSKNQEKNCKEEEKIWQININKKMEYPLHWQKDLYKLISIKTFKNDLQSCIVACEMNSECVGIEMNSNECHFTKFAIPLKEADGWTSIMLKCCKQVLPRKISNQPNHNLPIIFNTKTDCSPVVKKIEFCPPNEKVWLLEEKAILNDVDDVPCTKLSNHQLNSGLNKCIDDSSCSNVLEMDRNVSQCFNTKIDGKKSFAKSAKFLKLECCNFLNENLWTNRKRAIPILYDVEKMCLAHQAYEGQFCKIKIWKATDGAIMNAKPDLSIGGYDFGFVKCLEKCLEDKNCFTVDVAVDECHLYKDKKSNLLYGYHLYTSYQLMCCNIKLKS